VKLCRRCQEQLPDDLKFCPHDGAAIVEMLFDLGSRFGATLVLVTHATELAARCDRVIGLADGEIVPATKKAAAE